MQQKLLDAVNGARAEDVVVGGVVVERGVHDVGVPGARYILLPVMAGVETNSQTKHG